MFNRVLWELTGNVQTQGAVSLPNIDIRTPAGRAAAQRLQGVLLWDAMNSMARCVKEECIPEVSWLHMHVCTGPRHHVQADRLCLYYCTALIQAQSTDLFHSIYESYTLQPLRHIHPSLRSPAWLFMNPQTLLLTMPGGLVPPDFYEDLFMVCLPACLPACFACMHA